MLCFNIQGIGNSTVLEVGSHFSGLEIVLNVHQEKYPFTSEDVGFRVLIHEPGKTRYPFLDGRELLFSPGVSASVRFRKIKVIKCAQLSPPIFMVGYVCPQFPGFLYNSHNQLCPQKVGFYEGR